MQRGAGLAARDFRAAFGDECPEGPVCFGFAWGAWLSCGEEGSGPRVFVRCLAWRTVKSALGCAQRARNDLTLMLFKCVLKHRALLYGVWAAAKPETGEPVVTD